MMLNYKIYFSGYSLLIFGIFFFNPGSAYSQIEKTEIDKRMETGYKFMIAGDYDSADEEFRFVLDNAASLPPDICYYFGLNSFYMGKYKQSINWLNKYIELKGTGGQFFENTEKYLKLAEEAYRKENEAKKDAALASGHGMESYEVDSAGERIQKVIDCERVGKIICPVCNGKGVIIKEGLFGKEYTTCPYGDDYGYMSCEDYNLLLQGKLKPKKRE